MAKKQTRESPRGWEPRRDTCLKIPETVNNFRSRGKKKHSETRLNSSSQKTRRFPARIESFIRLLYGLQLSKI